MALGAGVTFRIACLSLLVELSVLNHESSMFPPWLRRKTEKTMKTFKWDAQKLSREVMYFEDILKNSNTLIVVLKSNTYLPYHLKHELVTLSLSAAQQSKVKGHCHSISLHRYRT